MIIFQYNPPLKYWKAGAIFNRWSNSRILNIEIYNTNMHIVVNLRYKSISDDHPFLRYSKSYDFPQFSYTLHP